jgi:hypothetical protein
MRTLWVRLKDLAPYAVIALVVPGGSLMAAVLWRWRAESRRTATPEIQHVR